MPKLPWLSNSLCKRNINLKVETYTAQIQIKNQDKSTQLQNGHLLPTGKEREREKEKYTGARKQAYI